MRTLLNPILVFLVIWDSVTTLLGTLNLLGERNSLSILLAFIVVFSVGLMNSMTIYIMSDAKGKQSIPRSLKSVLKLLLAITILYAFTTSMIVNTGIVAFALGYTTDFWNAFSVVREDSIAIIGIVGIMTIIMSFSTVFLPFFFDDKNQYNS